jgi:hypothetical protein
MERNKRKIGRWLGVMAAVLVPAIATAALTIPNTFSAGTVIKSADVNANFAAVAAAVNSDESTIVALQNSVAALQTTVNSLQTTVTSHTSAISSLQSAVAATPQIIGFAHFNGANGTIASFGGAGTTGVTPDPYYGYGFPWLLTFTGKYPAGLTAARLTLLATPEVAGYSALDASVISVSSTAIAVEVYVWQSSSLAAETSAGFNVALLLAN